MLVAREFTSPQRAPHGRTGASLRDEYHDNAHRTDMSPGTDPAGEYSPSTEYP